MNNKNKIEQYKEEIINTVLKYIGLYSPQASNLILFTAIHESHLDFLLQYPSKIAKSYYQIEDETHNDLYINYLQYRPNLFKKLVLFSRYHIEIKNLENNDLKEYIKHFIANKKYEFLVEELVYNLYYATACCRLIYYRQPFKIEDVNTIDDIAKVWKQYYNTKNGKGTEKEFIENAKKYINYE